VPDGGAEVRVEVGGQLLLEGFLGLDLVHLVQYKAAANGLGLLHSASQRSRSHVISQKNTHMKLCRSSGISGEHADKC